MAVYITTDSDGVMTAALTGEIDHHSATWLRTDIETAINDSRPRLLRLDFEKVGFMDSSGVGLVMGRLNTMRRLRGELELVNLPDYIRRVMLMAKIDRYVKIK